MSKSYEEVITGISGEKDRAVDDRSTARIKAARFGFGGMLASGVTALLAVTKVAPPELPVATGFAALSMYTRTGLEMLDAVMANQRAAAIGSVLMQNEIDEAGPGVGRLSAAEIGRRTLVT